MSIFSSVFFVRILTQKLTKCGITKVGVNVPQQFLVHNRELHGNGDGGNTAVTAVIPRIFSVNLAVIPRGWSHLLRGYRGNGTFVCGNTVVVKVCYL